MFFQILEFLSSFSTVKCHPSEDISISINENPRGKQNFNTIRLLDIPTSSDDFDRYIESQIALYKLNTNLSEEDYVIEQESELKRKLIDSIVYFQSSRKNGKECAYFEAAFLKRDTVDRRTRNRII